MCKNVSVFRAEIHKYYEECDWSKKWAEVLQKQINLKGLHRLDINDYLSTFFLFVVINVVDYFYVCIIL